MDLQDVLPIEVWVTNNTKLFSLGNWFLWKREGAFDTCFTKLRASLQLRYTPVTTVVGLHRLTVDVLNTHGFREIGTVCTNPPATSGFHLRTFNIC